MEIPVQELLVPQPKKYSPSNQTIKRVGRPSRTVKIIFLVLSFIEAS